MRDRYLKNFVQVSGIALTLLLTCSSVSRSESVATLEPALRLALEPGRSTSQYNYVMTGKVRLLLFWVGADDVGGGYVRRGVSFSDPSSEFIEVLFGSDPAKAPKHINQWGSAIEMNGPASVMLGFMKSMKTATPDVAQAELESQKAKDEYPFEAILSLVDRDRALSRVVHMRSPTDFDFHQLSRVQQLAAEELRRDGPLREMTSSSRRCSEARGFLFAVNALTSEAIRARTSNRSVCYVHNSRDYTLTLKEQTPISSKKIEFELKTKANVSRTYRDLILARFVVLNHQSGEKTEFELLLQKSEEYAGIPIQITYQPNFWFKVILNRTP